MLARCLSLIRVTFWIISTASGVLTWFITVYLSFIVLVATYSSKILIHTLQHCFYRIIHLICHTLRTKINLLKERLTTLFLALQSLATGSPTPDEKASALVRQYQEMNERWRVLRWEILVLRRYRGPCLFYKTPKELLLEIGSELNYWELKALSRTCRLWKEVIEHPHFSGPLFRRNTTWTPSSRKVIFHPFLSKWDVINHPTTAWFLSHQQKQKLSPIKKVRYANWEQVRHLPCMDESAFLPHYYQLELIGKNEKITKFVERDGRAVSLGSYLKVKKDVEAIRGTMKQRHDAKKVPRACEGVFGLEREREGKEDGEGRGVKRKLVRIRVVENLEDF